MEKDFDEKIITDLPILIHDILIYADREYKGDKVMLEFTALELKKVVNSEIENTLKILKQINELTEEEKQLLEAAEYL